MNWSLRGLAATPSQSGTLMPKRELKLKRSTSWVSGFLQASVCVCQPHSSAFQPRLYLTQDKRLPPICTHSDGTERCSGACHSTQQDVKLLIGGQQCAFLEGPPAPTVGVTHRFPIAGRDATFVPPPRRVMRLRLKDSADLKHSGLCLRGTVTSDVSANQE